MKLTNPTDDQLNAAFAEHVAGWVPYVAPKHKGRLLLPYSYFDDAGVPHVSIAPFTRSADAVLPLLEKVAFRFESGKAIGCQYRVSILGDCDFKEWNRDGWYYGIAPTFPRAAVIALLRAHGVEVEFLK